MAHSPAPTALHIEQLQAHAPLPLAAQLALRVAVAVAKWDRRRRSRIALSKLTPSQLRDVGISPYDAQLELQKPCWRP
ncbi:DUF1127 domain-containing protein [Tropicimonas marinistellae]|uniref:DUF1127 domain-containing protein n=1 Tax=Tropicimonas marinistellae TaxID=1739787 RepID=UPI00083330B8|nr:DUF1127 domain-containing protein [Tropicimonas marinistellae]